MRKWQKNYIFEKPRSRGGSSTTINNTREVLSDGESSVDEEDSAAVAGISFHPRSISSLTSEYISGSVLLLVLCSMF